MTKKRLQQIGVFLSALLLGSLFNTSPVFVRDASAEVETSLKISTGFRFDDLDWNIEDTDGSPNILSELTWTDLAIVQIKADGKLIIGNSFYMRGALGYGEIFDGDNQDSDYAGDDRTLEFSRSNNDADEGYVLDASVGLGYQFKLKEFAITPLVGYSYHKQNLVITNGFQTIPAFGSFSGLNSSYDAQWKGPWTGFDMSFKIIEELTLSGVFEYHWADYEAVADWNLRTDFEHPKSFEHIADGNGILLSAAINYAFNKHWGIGFLANYQKWSTDAGISRTFFSNGTQGETSLNEVNWESVAAEIGVTMSF